MMSEAEEPHVRTRGERLEPKDERSADRNTADSPDGRLKGFVMEWVLQDPVSIAPRARLNPAFREQSFR